MQSQYTSVIKYTYTYIKYTYTYIKYTCHYSSFVNKISDV